MIPINNYLPLIKCIVLSHPLKYFHMANQRHGTGIINGDKPH